MKITMQINGEIGEAPKKTIRYGKHYEVLIALGKDATGSFYFDEDGMEYLKKNNFIK